MNNNTELSQDEKDPLILWGVIHRLRAEMKGPNGFATWRDAAIAERVRRAATDSAATVAKEGGEVRLRPIRYTNDGALKECPCCCSLDVGGAHHTVHCQECGLTVTAPGPLQNAMDKWNLRPSPIYTAPKPEASAATQQAGRYTCIGKGGSYELIGRASPAGRLHNILGAMDIPVYRDVESGLLFVRDGQDFDVRMERLAAPISEDTGRTWATDGGYRCKNCGNGLTSHKNQRDCQPPAAQVSDGDAMPVKPWQHRLPEDRVATGKERAYARDAEIADLRAALAARTVTGSGGGIGEDDEFCELAGDWSHAREMQDGGPEEWAALIAYIHRWASRNAGVAAPDTSARKLTGAEILADPFLAYHFGLNRGKGPVSPTGWKIVRAVQTVLAKSKGQS